MSGRVSLGGTVGMGAGVALVVVLCAGVAGALLVTAAVVGLVPLVGLPLALVAVAGGLVLVAGLAVLALRVRLRRLAARRRELAPLGGAIELALMLLPRRRLAQLEAWLAAGLALGTVLVAVLRRDREAG